MLSQGYTKNAKTKSPHSLDSWVYDYIGASGNKDNIKIEINYSLCAHVLPAEERPIITEHFSSEYRVKTLAPIEIYGSKINALLSRAAARDLYDVRNMIYFRLFDESEEALLRKAVVFYAAISAKEINKIFDTKAIDFITKNIDVLEINLLNCIFEKTNLTPKNQWVFTTSSCLLKAVECVALLVREQNRKFNPLL